MYNIVIVDDETEIRNGIKLKVDWNELGFRIAGEASNGREALELIERSEVDVLITDIRMPFMDGLALLEQCAVRYPRIKTVILSGYDDFSYTRTAIQLKASDYLLKPVVRRELIELMNRLRGELDRERMEARQKEAMEWNWKRNLPLLQEQLLLELIHGDTEFPAVSREHMAECGLEDILRPGQPIQFVCVEMRIPYGRLGDRQDQQDLLKTAFQMFCRDFAQASAERCAVFHDWRHRYMMHFVLKRGAVEHADERVREFVHSLSRDIRRFLRVESVAGVGEPVPGPAKLRDGYISALHSWSRGKVGAQSQIVWPDSGDNDFIELTNETEKKMLHAIRHADGNMFEETVRAALGEGKGYSVRAMSHFFVKVLALLDSAAKMSGLDAHDVGEFVWRHSGQIEEVRSEEDIVGRLAHIAGAVMERIERMKPAGGSQIIDAVQRFIDRNYAEEINLGQLAERFYLNPTYLSELFKKTTGSTFSEYLTGVRMAKAAELLERSGLRVADVAELTGFSNASYFSSAFKKYFGVSPNDYRAQAGNGADRG